MDLSIIIVNYNTREYVLKCLESIYREEYARDPERVEILVVDNASVDGSMEAVHRQFPQVKTMVNRDNLGFAKANNQALGPSRGRYALLLNSDTEVIPPALKTLVEFMDTNPRTAVTGSRVLNPDMSFQGSARKFPTPKTALFGRTTIFTKLFPRNPITREEVLCFDENINGNSPFETDWVSGAALAVRREAFEQVGLLDEDFFMFWEDADWCKRFHDAGWKVYCVPASQIIHYGGAAIDQRSLRTIIAFHQSAYRYYYKHNIKSPFSFQYALLVVGLFSRACLKLLSKGLLRVIKGK